MAKTGPKPLRADGYHVTRKGYLRGRHNGRLRMQHVVVWETAHGAIPKGYHVHHINEDKIDNRIENLVLVDATTHKRIHDGCELRDGIWWKPCKICRTMKPIDVSHWYISREGWPLYGRCRSCHCDVASKRVMAPTAARAAARQPRPTATSRFLTDPPLVSQIVTPSK